VVAEEAAAVVSVGAVAAAGVAVERAASGMGEPTAVGMVVAPAGAEVAVVVVLVCGAGSTGWAATRDGSSGLAGSPAAAPDGRGFRAVAAAEPARATAAACRSPEEMYASAAETP
jgi:hypothetical protein